MSVIMGQKTDPCIPPFKVTPGHWNQHGFISYYDFLLLIHSNHGPISYHFQDKQQLLS